MLQHFKTVFWKKVRKIIGKNSQVSSVSQELRSVIFSYNYSIMQLSLVYSASTVINLFSALCAKFFQSGGKFLKYFFSFKHTF